MPGIGHLGVGLAAKRFAPKASLGALLVASEATDLLWGGLALAGIEGVRDGYWSHSLLTSAILSAAGALAGARAYRDACTGAVIGLVVLSHWALDYLVWKDSLPLLFEGSPKVGLGLYGAEAGKVMPRPSLPVLAIEVGLPVLGLACWLTAKGAPGKAPAQRLSTERGLA